MKPRISSIIAVLALAVLSTGCLGILSGGGGEEKQASFIVYNDVQPQARVTIKLRRNDKDVATLGTIEAGDQRTLTYSAADFSGNFRLVSDQPSGAASISREFTLFDGAQVRWQIRANTLSVLQ